jgi:hypothetical protein
MQFKANAFSGRGYVFFESWFTGRKEWDIFEWEGPGWQYPVGKQMLGGCNSEAKIPPEEAPKEPEASDVDCQVGIYPGLNFGGDVNYRYYVASNNREEYENAGTKCGADLKDKCGMKTLPSQVEDVVMSVKAFGNCEKVELIDNDGDAQDKNGMQKMAQGRWENGMIWYDQGGIPSLPWDLQSDVRGVFIKALPPRGYVCSKYKVTSSKTQSGYDERSPCVEGKELKLTDNPLDSSLQPYWMKSTATKEKVMLKWHTWCMVFVYRYSDYIGFLYKMETDDAGTFKKKLQVESVQLSPGCKQVKLWDDDWSGSQDNKEIVQSRAILDYDLRQDIKQYDLVAYGFKEAKPDPGETCRIKICKDQNYGGSCQYSPYFGPATYENQEWGWTPDEWLKDEVSSVKKDSAGCKKFQMIDDDSSGRCSPYSSNDVSDLDNFYSSQCSDSSRSDLNDDISKYYIVPKFTSQSQQEKDTKKKTQDKIQSKTVTTKVNPEFGSWSSLEDQPKAKPMTKKPTPGNCWICETGEPSDSPGYAQQICWKGAKSLRKGMVRHGKGDGTLLEKSCGDVKLRKTLVDKDCKCNDFKDAEKADLQKADAQRKEIEEKAKAGYPSTPAKVGTVQDMQNAEAKGNAFLSAFQMNA